MAAGKQRIVVVMGTRPEAVKLLEIVRLLGPRALIAHTGQHYDHHMWTAVSNEVGLPPSDIRIDIGGNQRGVQIGTATTALTKYLIDHPATAVIVQGDTNSTLAGALAANATNTFLVHVEAGLRSDDLRMPEESNRLLTDRVTDLCCAPTAANAQRLRAEGIHEERISITGNTLFDAMDTLLPPEDERQRVLRRLQVTPGGYVLATIHRQSNIEDPQRLAALLRGLDEVAASTPVLLPLHPHTRRCADAAGLVYLLDRIHIVPPLPPKEFLALESRAGLLISDSGGVQEEACFLRRPLLLARDSTERPELLDGWCTLLGDADPVAAMRHAWDTAASVRAQLMSRPLPYPESGASETILRELGRHLGLG